MTAWSMVRPIVLSLTAVACSFNRADLRALPDAQGDHATDAQGDAPKTDTPADGTGLDAGDGPADGMAGDADAPMDAPIDPPIDPPVDPPTGEPLRPNGAACTVPGECTSGFCVGKPARCCDTACEGEAIVTGTAYVRCQACSTGYCEPINESRSCTPTGKTDLDKCEGPGGVCDGTTPTCCMMTTYRCRSGACMKVVADCCAGRYCYGSSVYPIRCEPAGAGTVHCGADFSMPTPCPKGQTCSAGGSSGSCAIPDGGAG